MTVTTPTLPRPCLVPTQPPIRIGIQNPYRSTMGLQSQHTGSRIKACKKAGSKRNKYKSNRLKQTGIGGRKPFVQLEDCKVCKAQHLIEQGKTVSIPHRSHHKLCPKNTKTRGGSIRTVEFEKVIRHNIKINNIAPVDQYGRTKGTSAVEKMKLWDMSAAVAAAKRKNLAAIKNVPSNDDATENVSSKRSDSSLLPLGVRLRIELDGRLGILSSKNDSLEEYKSFTYIKEKANCPLPITLLFHYIEDQIRMKT